MFAGMAILVRGIIADYVWAKWYWCLAFTRISLWRRTPRNTTQTLPSNSRARRRGSTFASFTTTSSRNSSRSAESKPWSTVATPRFTCGGTSTSSITPRGRLPGLWESWRVDGTPADSLTASSSIWNRGGARSAECRSARKEGRAIFCILLKIRTTNTTLKARRDGRNNCPRPLRKSPVAKSSSTGISLMNELCVERRVCYRRVILIFFSFIFFSEVNPNGRTTWKVIKTGDGPNLPNPRSSIVRGTSRNAIIIPTKGKETLDRDRRATNDTNNSIERQLPITTSRHRWNVVGRPSPGDTTTRRRKTTTYRTIAIRRKALDIPRGIRERGRRTMTCRRSVLAKDAWKAANEIIARRAVVDSPTNIRKERKQTTPTRTGTSWKVTMNCAKTLGEVEPKMRATSRVPKIFASTRWMGSRNGTRKIRKKLISRARNLPILRSLVLSKSRSQISTNRKHRADTFPKREFPITNGLPQILRTMQGRISIMDDICVLARNVVQNCVKDSNIVITIIVLL